MTATAAATRSHSVAGGGVTRCAGDDAAAELPIVTTAPTAPVWPSRSSSGSMAGVVVTGVEVAGFVVTESVVVVVGADDSTPHEASAATSTNDATTSASRWQAATRLRARRARSAETWRVSGGRADPARL